MREIVQVHLFVILILSFHLILNPSRFFCDTMSEDYHK